jgi:hypothetical protein
MTSILKMAALGAIVTLSVGAIAAPVMAQERLCMRFDNKSLISEADEGQDAYDRAASLGNRCFANYPRLNKNIILPFPSPSTLNNRDFYFLTAEQRRLMGISTVNPDTDQH